MAKLVEQSLSTLADVENQIAACLDETSDELAHAECFDEEQRAEIYAIIQALKTDTDNHRQTITLLSKSLKEAPNA